MKFAKLAAVSAATLLIHHAAAPAADQTSSEKQAERRKSTCLCADADRAEKRFDNKKALRLYIECDKRVPNNPKILFNIGRLYINLGEESKTSAEAEGYYVKAVAMGTRLVKLFPERADGYFLLAAANGKLSLLKTGNARAKAANKVVRYARKAASIDPKLFDAYIVLGIYYREVSKLNWLVKIFAKTIGNDIPDNPLEKSEEYLRKAYALRPDLVMTNYELATTLELERKNDQARKFYEAAIRLPVSDHEDKKRKAAAIRKLRSL